MTSIEYESDFSMGGRQYQCLFFENYGAVPSEVKDLLKDTQIDESRTIEQPCVEIDDCTLYLHEEGPERYGIDYGSLNRCLFRKGIYDAELGRREYQRLNKMINIDKTLPVEMCQRTIREFWTPAAKIRDSPNEWLSLLLDVTDLNPLIVGTYAGDLRRSGGYQFNIFSNIELLYNYRGRGLCKPFASFTYAKVRQAFGVDFFCIQVGAENQYAACRCYIQAAMDAGFIPYINRAQAPDVRPCNIYQRDPFARMILIHPDAKITVDTVMDLCGFNRA
jgi:hypothetical protein